MPSGCGCAGKSCGCSVVAGSAVEVEGVGSASDPFVISFDPSNFPVAEQVVTSDSTTIDFSSSGVGTPADPLIISARVVLTAPNGSRYTPVVSNTGVLSTVAI